MACSISLDFTGQRTKNRALASVVEIENKVNPILCVLHFRSKGVLHFCDWTYVLVKEAKLSH